MPDEAFQGHELPHHSETPARAEVHIGTGGVSFGEMPGESPAPRDLDATVHLLALVRAGDDEALNRLFERYAPALRRWASGRLPHWARDLAETQDLVQDTLLQVFKKID